jgi:hypothetical protein
MRLRGGLLLDWACPLGLLDFSAARTLATAR